MTKKISKKGYQKPKVLSSKIETVSFYGRSSYSRISSNEYLLAILASGT